MVLGLIDDYVHKNQKKNSPMLEEPDLEEFRTAIKIHLRNGMKMDEEIRNHP